jgi:hypothetical protein
MTLDPVSDQEDQAAAGDAAAPELDVPAFMRRVKQA